MDETLNEFKKEIETLIRIVNGYLQTNTSLQDFEVSILSIKPKEVEMNSMKAEGVREVVSRDSVNLNVSAEDNCKICYDENGHAYCYFGPNGCPTF